MSRAAWSRLLAPAPAGLVASLLLAAALWAALEGGGGPLELGVGGRRLILESPRALVLLAAAPFLLGVALASLTDFSRARRLLQSGLRFAFLALLALALARPSLRHEERAVSVVALVDVSASIGDRQLEAERDFLARVARVAAARSPPAALRVVRYAADPEELAAAPTRPGTPPVLPRVDRFEGARGDETDLGLALGLGLGLLDPSRVPRLLVLGDGRATRGDATAHAARAAARGARVLFQIPAGGDERDIAVLELSAPEEVQPHAAFDLEIRLLATHAGSARLRLFQDGRPHAPDAERTVSFDAGVTVVRWTTRIARGGAPVVYRAEIADATENRRPQNDFGVLAVAPRPRPRVLLVEAGGPGGAGFLRALRAEGIDGEARPPRALAAGGWADSHDLVVLADVPRASLSPAAIDALDRFVREGGGLLVTGGPESLGADAYAGTRLAALLPLRHDPTAEREEATLGLALVIDRSGSMSGPKMELTKEAARGTAQMLSPEDLISVIVFDSQAHSVVRLQPASNRQRILNDIAQIRASGGTNILPGLREAFEQLLPARARKKHVILLSDGQSPYDGIQELVDEAAGAHVTISAVGVGEGADQTLLQMIATRGGGRFYHTRDPASIPQIFTRETAELSRSSVIEVPTRIRMAKAAEMLAGLSLEAAPPLGGYTRTRARKEAEVLLQTSRGDPLLARWQVGLGQVAAWTSDLSARWSADLARWAGFAKLWAQVARGTMRRGAANRFPIRARLVGDRAEVRIEALGADDRPLAGLRGELEVLATTASGGDRAAASAPAGPARRALSETAPGRYEADVPVPGPGGLLLQARLFAAGTDRVIADAHGRLSVPFAREVLPVPPAPGRALLQALAERTDGSEVTTAEAVVDPGPDRVEGVRPLRVPLLVAALLLFLADVALRRVRLPRS